MEFNKSEFNIIWEALCSYQEDVLNNKSDYSRQERDAKWASICEAMSTIQDSLCDGEGCGYYE